MRKEMDEIKNAMKEKTTKNLDEMVKKDRFSFHNQGSGMPLAAKILPSTTWFIWWFERPIGSQNHLQDDIEFTANS